jgi:hypothetical protein
VTEDLFLMLPSRTKTSSSFIQESNFAIMVNKGSPPTVLTIFGEGDQNLAIIFEHQCSSSCGMTTFAT